MELQFLRQEAMDVIQKEIGRNIQRYAQEQEDWTESFFLEKGVKVPLIRSGLLCDDIILLSGEGSAQDIENAIILHTAFKDIIKPVQAADRRLWVAMTHTVFYQYMTSRWPVDNTLNERGTNGTVTDRYFVSRGLFRNGISRLYWLAELTYDASLDDPYEYTRYLVSYQDLINQIEGRALCRNRNVLRSCLNTLKNSGELSERQKRQFFEGMCKIGGVRVLDALPPDMLEELCKENLDHILKIKHITNGSRVTLQSMDTGSSIVISVIKGKAYIGKNMFATKPENLYRLSVGNEMELGKTRYLITDIQ